MDPILFNKIKNCRSGRDLQNAMKEYSKGNLRTYNPESSSHWHRITASECIKLMESEVKIYEHSQASHQTKIEIEKLATRILSTEYPDVAVHTKVSVSFIEDKATINIAPTNSFGRRLLLEYGFIRR